MEVWPLTTTALNLGIKSFNEAVNAARQIPSVSWAITKRTRKKPCRNQWLRCPYSLDSNLILRCAKVWDSELKSSTTLSFKPKQWTVREDHTLLPSNCMSLQAKEQGAKREDCPLKCYRSIELYDRETLTAILSISLSSARLPLLRISTSTLITYVADYLTAKTTRGFPRARLSIREFPSFIKYLDGDYNPLFHDPISGLSDCNPQFQDLPLLL